MFLRSNAGRNISGTSQRIGQLKQNVKNLGPNKIISETFEMTSEQVITVYFAKKSTKNKQLSIDGAIHYTNDTVFVPYIKKVYGSYGWNYDSGGNFVSALALRDIQDVIISDGDNNIRVEVEFDLERPCIIITNLRLGPTTVSFNFSPVFGNNKLKNSIVNWILEFSSETVGEMKNAVELESRDDSRLSIVPSVENSDEILQWLGSIHNKPWNGYPQLSYSTITISNTSDFKFAGGVLTQDGRVVFVPYDINVVGVFNPADNSYQTYTGPSTDQYKFWGGVLTADGRVVFVPYFSNVIGVFNPADNSYTTYNNLGSSYDCNGGVLAPDGRVIFVSIEGDVVGAFNPVDNSYQEYGISIPVSSKFINGTLSVDGRVIFVPCNGTVIGAFNPVDNSYQEYTGPNEDSVKFSNGVLASDGRIVFVPNNSSVIGVFNPVDNSYSTYTGPSTDFNKFRGGVLAPDGRIIFIPYFSSVIGIFNPIDNSYTEDIEISLNNAKFTGGILLPDGRVVFAPHNSDVIGILSGATPYKDSHTALHPFYNKF